jgi:tetratricopeptide (TPR) repeat protein
MSSRNLTQICVLGFFVLGVLWVMGSWSAWDKDEKVIHQLLSVLLLAVVGGFIVVTVLLPRIGDAVSTAMTSSNEEVRQEGASKALALVASGNYEGAIKEYQRVLAEKPDDSFAVSEIAKVCSDKLRDPARALQVLREHLEGREWPVDDAAFLMFRMVDIHLQQHQFDDARALLEQIETSFPNTRHTGNARHKINEVEQAEFKFAQAQRARGAQG